MTNDPILAVCIRAARRAASVIVDAARDLRKLPAHARDRNDIASNADTDAEDAIIATLRAAFPGHAIVGEEAGEIVSQIGDGAGGGGASTFKWIIDPLDGAANFVHGYPYCAVSIALTQGNDVTHAVVLDPVHDELFTAAKGKGAQQNGTPIRTSTCVRLGDALVGTVLPAPASPTMPSFLRVHDALVAQCAGIRAAGAGALDLAYVAAGRLDAFWLLNARSSDIAAGALIVTEAGGRIDDLAGGTDAVRAKELVAATPGVFNALREAIATARR